MKTFKKQFIAGIGRALGMITVYAVIALIILAFGIKLDVSKFPPVAIENEIVSTFNNQ